MLTPLARVSYVARQGARAAWYMGHYFASRRFREPKPGEETRQPRKPSGQGPSLENLFAGMGALFARDLANAGRGYYPLPRDHDGTLREVIEISRRFFSDLPIAAERKQSGLTHDIPSTSFAEFDTSSRESAGIPEYFLQNFHYQTGGYLTSESARLYDMQVEVLFSGTANAMRRQCLVPVAEFLKGKDQRRARLLDVACGTGRFLRFAKEAFPRLPMTGLDLSPAYLDEASRHLQPYEIETRNGAAESLPFADGAFDIVTSIYLFHEVPPEVRPLIARELSRVVKPLGRVVVMDSLQLGDTPEFDALLKSFPANFHEPYFTSYLSEDFPAMFAAAGLKLVSAEPIFLSKMFVFEKA